MKASPRRLLRQAGDAQLESVRQSEVVSSGPGSHAETEYRLHAPNRMAFKTGAGVESVLIGKRKRTRWPGAAGWADAHVVPADSCPTVPP